MKALVLILTILTTISPLLSVYNSNHRLPNYVVPLNYTVHITPYFLSTDYYKQGTFEGKAIINIKFKNDSYFDFGLNSQGLRFSSWRMRSSSGDEHDLFEPGFDTKTGIVQVPMRSRPSADLEYTLEITFAGDISNGHDGLYQRSYIDRDGHERWIIATNLRHGNARKLFPCFDETRFLTPFRIRIRRPKEYTAFANTELVKPKKVKKNRSRYLDKFKKTPKTETSSLGFVISEFKRDEEREDSKIVSIHVQPEYQNNTDFSLYVAETFLRIYGERFFPYEYLGIRYLRIFGIPNLKKDGQSAAWGLITLDENLLLNSVEDNEATIWDKQNTITSLSHEVVYQWLGNAVNLTTKHAFWLSEGLATYYEYFETNKVFPEYDLDKQFIIQVMHKALAADGGNSTRPLVQDELDISSEITSNVPHMIKSTKGACIIRMIAHCMTERIFKIIISDTIVFNLKVFKGSAFFVPPAQKQFPWILDDFLPEWTNKVGYPLLKVEMIDRGWIAVVNQSRYVPVYDGSNVTYRYSIPLSYTTNRERDFSTTFPKKHLANDTDVIKLYFDAPIKWVVLNIQQTSFYRVKYSTALWHELHKALNQDNWSGIHELNRAQYVDDLLSFGRSGVLNYNMVFMWLEYLQTETEYTPWMAALNGFKQIMPHLTINGHIAFGNLILFLTEKVYWKLGVVGTNASEPITDTYLRKEIVRINCRYGRETCTDEVQRIFHHYLYDNVPIPVGMRSTVLCAAMRDAPETIFDMLHVRYSSTDSPRDRLRIRYAMGCVRNRKNVDKFYKFVLSEEVPIAEKEDALIPLYTENPENVWIVYKRVTEGHRDLVKACKSWKIAANIIKHIAEHLTQINQKNEFREFIQMKRLYFEDSARILDDAFVNVNANLRWSMGYLGSLERYLEPWSSGAFVVLNNYVILFMLILPLLTHIII